MLRAVINSANRNNREEVAETLDAFIAENPSSVWTPTLRANLGRHYCTEGRWTKALEHWERAWSDTKQYRTGAGKRVGDYTLTCWTRLLAELGRLDELQVIFAEAEGRRLDGGPLSQKYLRTKEMCGILRHRPEAAYRCGWLVLNKLALATRGQRFDPARERNLYQESNLMQSCSMRSLAQVALSQQWSLTGVERPEGSRDLPVPSLMHLKQGHYVALLRADGTAVLAYDPIYGVRHFRRDVLDAESSGRFMLDSGRVPVGWRELSVDEMAATVGRSGIGFTYPDQEEGECDACDCPGTPGGRGGDGFGESRADDAVSSRRAEGGSGPSCGGCGGSGGPAGMPQWRVTEPNINLWLRDQPISCQPAYGPAVALDLQFKQRDELWAASDTFSFGPSWNSHWLSHVYCDPYYGLWDAIVYLPGGGMLTFMFPQGETVSTNYEYNGRLTATLNNGAPVAFTLDFPDGRQYVYERVWNFYNFYMSRSVDSQGFVTQYNYVEEENGSVLHLATVADQAGDPLFTLQYTNGTVYPSLISVVTDRFGRSARFLYTEDEFGYSLLSRIEDAAGLPSMVSYDENGWPQTLITPYGSTMFEYDCGQADYTYYRQARITEANGGSQRYLFTSSSAYLWNGDPWMPSEIPASLIPDNLPQGAMIDTSLQAMNSFYWNQGQNSSLPADLSQFTTNHFNKARMRHWLMKSNGELYVPDLALSSEVDASQSSDGTELGQITFYDHPGKSSTWGPGTQIQPSLAARKLPDGSTWHRAYGRNSFGLTTSETSTYGTANPASTRTYTYTYAANGQDVVERRGPSNELLATYGYNTRHQMTNEVLWPDSVTSYSNTWTYDAQGRLQSKTAAAGQTTTYYYNGSCGSYSGYLSGTSEQPVERTESFTWLDGMVRTRTDTRGLTVTNFWDGLGRLTGTLYPDGTATSNLYCRAASYPNSSGGLDVLDVMAAKDRLGHWSFFDYDALRRIVAKTNANGVVTRYGYCDCGSVSYITNAWGTPVQQVTMFTFDNHGNRTTETYADGYSVTNWFDPLARKTVSDDGTGYRWYFYNNQGLITTISNAYGAERTVTFDIRDRPEQVTDLNGVTVANAYDNLGRLLRRSYPDNGVEDFAYSSRGLVAYTNQLGYVARYAYDAAGRKTFETNANNEVIRYTNSAAGDLLSLTDGKNQTTCWGYDEYGRATNKLDQAGAEILRYKYDSESRLTNRWSAAKGETCYSYDDIGNLTFINYPNSSDVSFEYDWLSRLTNMVDAAGTTAYAYTAGNQSWTEDGPFTSDTITNVYSHRRRVALRLQQPSGLWTNGFGWDLAGRMTNVTSVAGAFGYTYTALYGGCSGGLIQKLSLPSGACITNFYDPVARLLSTRLFNSQLSTLNSHQYAYNAGNQRTACTNATGAFQHYTYDPIGQLTVADSSNNSEDRGYFYDAAWNLNRRTNSGAATWWYCDVKNQLTNGTVLGQMDYDGNGNLTNRSSAATSYEYDDENRLCVVEALYQNDFGDWAGFRSEFEYDGLGRLRRRVELTPQVDKVLARRSAGLRGGEGWYPEYGVEYLYDGWRVIQERASGGRPQVSYTRGVDLSGSLEGAGGIGGLLARSATTDGSNWTSHAYYHADGNGNITCLINTSQSVVATYRYDPFGNTLWKGGSLADANLYRFSSKEFHAASGMYYYGHRFYPPSLQRWVGRDPIGEKGFEALRRPREIDMNDGVNLYSFVLNDPCNNIDPNGLTLWLCSRKSTGFPGIGNHVYFWDDSGTLGPGKSCGMSGSSGKGTPGNPRHDTGPGTPGQACVAIPASQDPMSAKAIWDCCQKNANTGVWKPWGNDCHNKMDDCLTPFGFEPPKHPRLGHPRVIPTPGSSAPPPIFSPL